MGTDNSLCRADRISRRSMVQALGGGMLAGGIGVSGSAKAGLANTAGRGILDVAIIGAGLSGLTSARDLLLAGCEPFVVLEARDRVGGRTVNHDIGNGVVAEGGGQWIGPGQTAIFDLARELGIDTFASYRQGKSVYLVGAEKIAREPDQASESPIIRKLNAMARTVSGNAPWSAKGAAQLDSVSLGDWLESQSPTDDDRMTLFLSATLTYGAPPDKLSLLHYLTLVNAMDSSIQKLEGMKGGAQETRLVGGSYALSARMAEMLGDRIRLASPVRRIVGWDREVVELHTATGVVRARQAIVAMSQALCNRITFDPPLPPERAAMHRAWPTIARMRKTVHVYPRPFWRDAGFNGQVLEIGGGLLWSADNSPPDASVGILTAFVKQNAVPADPKRAAPALAKTFARALGDEALRYEQYHEIDWGTVDEWTLSCTSPYPPGFLTRWGKASREPMGRIHWSGTDMAELFPSSMDAAIRSGHRAALKVLAARLTQSA